MPISKTPKKSTITYQGDDAQVNSDGQLHIVAEGHLCTKNSTTTPLLADAVYTGEAENILAYNGIALFVTSDVASATGGIEIQYSKDGTTNWRTAESYTLVAGAEKWFTPPTFGAYFRVVFTNGGTDQTSFELTSTLRKMPFKWSSHNIEDPITDQDDATLSKAVITGKKADGDYDNVSLTNGGNMKVSLEELESGVSSNSNSQLNVTPFHADGTEGALITGIDYVSGKSGIDASTESLQVIDYAHHEIHSGSHFYIKNYMDLTNAQVFDFLAVTPDTLKWAHMLVEFNFEAEAHIQVYEGTTTSNDGTTVTPVNRNRNSSTTPTVSIYHTPTVTDVGTLIAGYKTGSGNKVGGEIRGSNELILKQNTKYLIRLTNDTALNNWVDYLADWYEHTDKN